MSLEVKIHNVQTSILKDLLFVKSARFADLQRSSGFDSDYFKFHIGRLVDIEYVSKLPNGDYQLTTIGKEYANKIDTEKNVIERQPKSAVILVIEDENNHFLIQERLKHPYFGFWGFPGGKIRWGETIIECASRELTEEAGITAELLYRGVYHEHVKSLESGDILEDKIFHVVYGLNKKGEIKESFDGGRNSWLSIESIKSKSNLYKSFNTELEVGLGLKTFVELEQTYTKNEF
ncbi:MAG: 8-oxo-dGTP diphosphatase [Patescibacteria group bacterium]|nr:8-oxo-dGTP diphosphatase [Patescibacteria group bacterium]